MRTSINLQPDVHDFATAYAAANAMTLSAAINCLLQRAEASLHDQDSTAGLKLNAHGYYVFPATGGEPITSEMVKKILDDTDY